MLPAPTAESYAKRYFLLEESLYQTELISLAASHALTDFPQKVVTVSGTGFIDYLEKFADALHKAADAAQKGDDCEAIEVTAPNPFAETALLALLTRHLSGETRPFDVTRLVLAQELSMLIAHFDAFFADTIRVICLRQPNVLKRQKHLSWAKALEFNTIDELRDHLIEQYCFELGVEPITTRLERLTKEHKLVALQRGFPECR